MERNGMILNEFGETVGRYWWREGSNTWTLLWHGHKSNGWTIEGIKAWANKLEYFVVENDD